MYFLFCLARKCRHMGPDCWKKKIKLATHHFFRSFGAYCFEDIKYSYIKETNDNNDFFITVKISLIKQKLFTDTCVICFAWFFWLVWKCVLLKSFRSWKCSPNKKTLKDSEETRSPVSISWVSQFDELMWLFILT